MKSIMVYFPKKDVCINMRHEHPVLLSSLMINDGTEGRSQKLKMTKCLSTLWTTETQRQLINLL